MFAKEIRNILMTDPEFRGKMSDVVKDTDSLLEGGIVDSFGLIHLVGQIEKKFDIKVDPNDLQKENFESISAVENFIKSKKG